MDITKTWESAKKSIMDNVSAISFDLWIKTLTPESFDAGEFVLAAVSTAAANQARNERHMPFIKSAIIDVAPIVEKVTIIDAVEKEARIAAAAGAGTADELAAEVVLAATRATSRLGMITPNETKTFNSYIVGKNNEYVAAAAEAVAKAPGTRINPLFIHGGVGLGKTHILHAIANHLAVYHPHLRVAFATCERFVSDYVEAIRTKTINDFRAGYRNVDVLLIDDIHTIENKTGTQEEFFHTFNDLYQNNKQIVLTSDRHADKFTTLEERMRSRFKSGLIQDVGTPDIETRMAILQKKASMENYRLDDDVANALAARAQDREMNIRDMEGLLNKVIFYAQLMGRNAPTIADIEKATEGEVEDKTVQATGDTIIAAVCKYFRVTREDLVGKRRNREFVEPRNFASYLMSEFLNIPLINIGHQLGGRDHSTILHARNKIYNALAAKDVRIMRIVEDLTRAISGGA